MCRLADSEKLTEDEIQEILNKHAHLRTYLKNIEVKMKRPEIYKKVPKSKEDEDFPNFIYTTKGSVFIHIYRLPEMDERLYQAIEPELDEITKKKFDDLLHLIVKKAPDKDSAVSDDELKEMFLELNILNVQFMLMI